VNFGDGDEIKFSPFGDLKAFMVDLQCFMMGMHFPRRGRLGVGWGECVIETIGDLKGV
jgi:hypothetical protein